MLPTSAGVEPATSWSPVGWRIQLSHRGRLYWGPLVEYFCLQLVGASHWATKCTTTILTTLVDLLSPMIYAKIQPQGFWRRRFLKAFTIYGHGGHLIQWKATILAIFHSPTPGRLQMIFEQHWPRGSRGEVICNSQSFPIQMHRETNLTSSKKVKCQCTTIILAILADLPSLMICAKNKPQGILGSEEDF